MTHPEPPHSLWEVMSTRGIASASHGFASMVGRPIQATTPAMHLMPLAEVPALFGQLEKNVVGISLNITGALKGQMVLVLTHDRACELTDMILGEPHGTTQTIGSLETSVLGELGNLTGSFFLNAVVSYAHIDVRPSPPTVMEAKLSVLFEQFTVARDVNRVVVVLNVAFLSAQQEVQASFWILPDSTQTYMWVPTAMPFAVN